jgi:hypothetical protein
MSWDDHDRVEELLAGIALGGLDPDDASLGERALVEHVPGCPACRSALDDFREIAGHLALAAPAMSPPETLGASLRRAVAMERRTGRRWTSWATAGAALLVVGALSAWNVMLFDRLNDTEHRQVRLVDAVSALGHPEAGVVPLSGSVEGRIQLLYVPGEGQAFLVASGMPKPDRGLYRVWLRGGDTMWHAGSFVPERGVVVIQLEPTADAFEHVLVTMEPNGDSPTPSAPPVAEGAVLISPPTPEPSPTALTPSPTASPTSR